VLARENAEVHLYALQTMTEQLQLCDWGLVQIWRLCWPGKMLKFTFMLFKP
jgi:hypothetical protein